METIIQTSFNAGEFSPLLGGHIDAPMRHNALQTCRNLIALPQGPVSRRPGTRFVASAKYPDQKTGLMRFEFNSDQAYMLEVGDRYIRIYHDRAVVLSGTTGLPYEVSTPYTKEQLWDAQGIWCLRSVQSADMLYLTHPSYPPHVLMRFAHDHWELTPIETIDGPYLEENTTNTTLTPSGLKGNITLTASADLFASTDTGRLIRIGHDHHYGYGKIIAYNTPRKVQVALRNPLTSLASTTSWRLGSWSETNGYPMGMALYQERLFFYGMHTHPERIEGSCSGDFMDFSPSDPDGTIADDHAVSVSLSADTINAISWLMPHPQGLLIGTRGGLWRLSSGVNNKALSPTALQAVCFSAIGSSVLPPVPVTGGTVCAQRARRKLYVVSYGVEEEGFKAPDMTLYAEHLMKQGLTQLVWQEEPYGIVWAIRADGILLGMTYEPDQQVAAWHQHALGGNGKVESIAIIPGIGEKSQELWMSVMRTQGENEVRHIEVLTLEDIQSESPSCVDSALYYTGASTHILRGLEHVESHTVSAVAMGASAGDHVVQEGLIILDQPCTEAVVGLPYRWEFETLPLGETLLSQLPGGMRPIRIDHIALRLLKSLGICYGKDEELLRNAGSYGQAPALFSGDTDPLPYDKGYKQTNTLHLSHTGPYPVTILAIMVQGSW